MELEERIFQAAIEEFNATGTKSTMDWLARRMGISKRTLYETIDSKTAVVEMVIDRTFADVKRQQREILNDETLPTAVKMERLFTVVPTYASVLDYRRIDEIRIAFPDLYKKIEYNLEHDWEPTIELYHQAVAEGILREKNIVLIKMLLVEVYEQLINGRTLIENNISYEDAMKEILNIIFEGLYVR